MVRVYCSSFMLFGVTLTNALRQSHAHESAHLQSLFLYATWALCITAFIFNIFSLLNELKKVSAPSTIDNVRFTDVDIRRSSRINPIPKERFGGCPLCSYT